MNERQKRGRVELYDQLCRERGVRSTVQRRVILEVALDLDGHPTADEVFDEVKARIPGIARPTVYRSLEHLARMGVITKACHPGRVARYDCRLEVHHHLVCLRCNEFVDFEDEALDNLVIPDTSAVGFDVKDFRVQLRGICASCRDAQAKEESK